jgi:hypothetical protein
MALGLTTSTSTVICSWGKKCKKLALLVGGVSKIETIK